MAADKQLLLAPEALRTKHTRDVNSAELSPDNTETSLVDAGSACALGALGSLDMNLGKPTNLNTVALAGPRPPLMRKAESRVVMPDTPLLLEVHEQH